MPPKNRRQKRGLNLEKIIFRTLKGEPHRQVDRTADIPGVGGRKVERLGHDKIFIIARTSQNSKIFPDMTGNRKRNICQNAHVQYFVSANTNTKPINRPPDEHNCEFKGYSKTTLIGKVGVFAMKQPEKKAFFKIKNGFC